MKQLSTFNSRHWTLLMETMESLKRRVHTAEDLHSLVRTMKALAALNIRQLEHAVESHFDGLDVLSRVNSLKAII